MKEEKRERMKNKSLINLAVNQEYDEMTQRLFDLQHKGNLSDVLFMATCGYQNYLHNHILYLMAHKNILSKDALNIYIEFFRESNNSCICLLDFIRRNNSSNSVKDYNISAFILAIITDEAVTYMKAHHKINILFYLLHIFRLYDKSNRLINKMLHILINDEDYETFIDEYYKYRKIQDNVQIKLDRHFEKCMAKKMMRELSK